VQLDVVFKSAVFDDKPNPVFCERDQWKIIYIDGRSIKAMDSNGNQRIQFETNAAAKSTNLSRQSTAGSWTNVFASMTNELSRRLHHGSALY